MARTYSYAVANARNDAVETAMGPAPLLRAYNGTMPTNARTALSGNTLLAEGALPSDWMAASVNGVKAKSGVWTMTGQAGAGAGTAATFYRIYDSTGTTCHEQGTFGESGTDMTVDTNLISNGQAITVSTFQKADGNLG